MATVAAPIDATSTAAWKALEAHQEKLEAEGIDLKAWFAADAERVNKLSFDAGDLHFDLSKNLVTDETVKLLCDLAREVKLEERRDAMFSGDTLFRCSCGRTDFAGGDYREMLQSLGRLGNLPGSYRVYPGHDQPTTLDYERRVNPYVRQGMK